MRAFEVLPFSLRKTPGGIGVKIFINYREKIGTES